MSARLWCAGWSGLTLLMSAALPAAEISLDALLEQVQRGRAHDQQENAARIKAFQADRARQKELLEQAKQERVREEQRSQDLEQEFEQNDASLSELEQALTERLGSLKELFGVLQQVSGDARGQFENSHTQVQFPDRTGFLSAFAQKMGQSNRLASLEEIERLWFELQREMTESGRVVRFPARVVTDTGQEVEREVVRVGLFNTISNGKYLEYVPETRRLVELPRQPQSRFLEKAALLEAADSGARPFALDPSRGQLLSLLVQTPSWNERIEQGGVVGYIIIGLGALALLIALERLLSLMWTSARVRHQIAKLEQPGNNPLGRVLSVYHANPTADVETLELKLGEAILKETPKLNRLLMFLKMIAVVAPLLGLLGTVVGMIITFQAITLFGTGDPKLMAGGISQALVTTVLGLCVAIPTVLLHTLVSSRAKRLTQILEEQATGMVAVQAEGRAARAG
ncbi:MAG: MotA/TolQ/ExbB proton channel family protein [Gammaproteobacteria bacterium]|nr:MotA/TolQ/ExbB proton channel family protein [Gammaproteobacteria bacterium]